jgi:FADH2 O2-dependent halogenase
MSRAQTSGEGRYDVAILGTGIGGTVLGAILAGNGARVALVEQGTHPRFAIGESTIPETTFVLRMLARRYSIPEIANLSNYHVLRSHVSAACGVKRNFSFVYHQPGEECRADEMTQYPTWAPPFGPDVHYYRQDVDAYMLGVARRYGADYFDKTKVREVDFSGPEVRISTETGPALRARFVVDAGGMKAPLAEQLGLRERPCTLETHSRSLYTHMTGVAPFDTCAPPRRRHGLPSPLCQGTLHHMFKGGWMWVIPFDNHPDSTSALCSVGVTVDPRVHPPTGQLPEVEFRSIISRMPSVAKQFAGAKASRPWVSTGRLQYNSVAMAGDRYCLLPHAGAFVDPLFSSGLSITMNAINSISRRILDGIADGDFSAERFQYVDQWVKRSFEYYDALVSGAYTSFDSFEMWNAWHRYWMLASLYGICGVAETMARFDHDHQTEVFGMLEEPPFRGVQGVDFEPYAALFKRGSDRMREARAPGTSPGDVARDLYAAIRESGLGPPSWGLDDPDRRWPYTFTILPMIRLVAWGRFKSPESVRRHYFISGRLLGFAEDIARGGAAELRRSVGAFGSYVRDALVSWNGAWARPKTMPAPPPAQVDDAPVPAPAPREGEPTVA